MKIERSLDSKNPIFSLTCDASEARSCAKLFIAETKMEKQTYIVYSLGSCINDVTQLWRILDPLFVALFITVVTVVVIITKFLFRLTTGSSLTNNLENHGYVEML
jgi:hypothetical protein